MKAMILTVSLLVLACTQRSARAAAPSPAAGKPPDDGQYVVVKDGRLTLDGVRQRYWAVIGGVYCNSGVKPADTPEQKAEKVKTTHRGTDVLVQRYIDLGFNACRFWRGFNQPTDYTPGDGSPADDVDYFIAKMKERGLRIWLAGMGGNAGQALPDDVNIISAPATADAWKAAVAEAGKGKGWDIRNNPARIWDPRLEAVGIRNMTNVATHVNRYTNLRWCDDPVFVVWELSNEEWWMRRMLGGSWQKLPAFFRNQLVARWNEFLKGKYGSDEKLKAAWKELLPGESIAKGTVLLAPMAGASKVAVSINDASPQAKEALEALKQEYSRSDFDPRRGEDVIEFLLDLQVKHKQREAAAIKPLGKSTRLCPMVYDTGIGYEIESQYLHQQADAVAHDAYVNGTGPEFKDEGLDDAPTELAKAQKRLGAERISANSGRWVNWLLKPPGICQGVPWLEHNRMEGKPYFCYEVQIQQPAKYRADFPLRLGALASIQDWDFVCWHYFGSVDDAGASDRPFDKRMDITTGSHPQGYHYTYDEVQNAMMRAAAWMWRQQLLAPAARPTKFIYGRKALYDPASMDYGGSYGMTGMDMMQTAYQYGCRIRIDPSRQDDEVIGPVVKFADRNSHNPYTPTDQIVFDWKKGYLMLDAPASAAFTGLLARYGEKIEFKSGLILKDVKINNPPGIYEPVKDDEKYIAFAVHSLDAQPLDKARKASLSVVSTSFNSGFALGGQGKPTVGGNTPVLVARVGATVQGAVLAGMKYKFHDWHMNQIGAGTIGADGLLKIPADQPVFCVSLER